jgi:integrase
MAGKGVYPRPPSSIQVYFRYEGKSFRETVDRPPTPRNLAYAEALRKEVLKRIELGTFVIEEFFPKSKHATSASTSPTFDTVALDWLDSKKRVLETTTLREYRNTLHYYRAFAKRPIMDITFLDLDRHLATLDVKEKTFNNVLSVGRGVFRYALHAKLIAEDPTIGIERAKISEPNPDPLNPTEALTVITHLQNTSPAGIANYFELAIFLGFRPSEGIALRWSDIDFNYRTVTIQVARVRSQLKRTKTNRSRLVELDDRCFALLQRQKVITGKHASGAVFVNPDTDRPFVDSSALLEKHWRPALLSLGIRHRDARQTRHTCATMMLMAGCNIAWSARQLGHSMEMFLKTYSTWIAKADKGRERGKIADFFTAISQNDLTT